MAYLVELTDRAVRDLNLLYEEKNVAKADAAARWFNGLEEAIYSLGDHPRRCPVAPEGRKMKRQLRHLLYGKSPYVYRVIYEVDERRQIVWVLHVRHGARRESSAPDFT